jgi:DNA-binding transcriptional LysR family regulator
MELRQLEYLVAVVEEASFTKAAGRLHVAQPGVSAQIRNLERELGVELLDRSGRSVRPTQAGLAVLPSARAALAGVGAVRATAEEMTGLIRGQVAVGMVTACGSVELPGILAAFHAEHPQVEMTLSEGNSDQLIAAVVAGELDLAWVGLAGPRPAGIASQVIVDEPLVAAVGPNDPCATRSTIGLGELSRRPLISLPKGTGLRSCLDRACLVAGLSPLIPFEANSLAMVAQLAARGLGVALLPRSVAGTVGAAAGLHAVRITGPGLQSRLELAWRAEGPISPAARALIDQARLFLDDKAAAPAA